MLLPTILIDYIYEARTRQKFTSMVHVRNLHQWYTSEIYINGTRQKFTSMVRVRIEINGTRQKLTSMVHVSMHGIPMSY